MFNKKVSLLVTQVRQYSRRKINAGLDKQMRKLDATEQLVQDPEGFGDMESDFMDVSRSHKDHERELYLQRQQIGRWVAKNKHFKVKLPNFLTYAEKQQIKLLNAQDPEDWTAEKLAESFPADPETIGKIIKAKWMPRSEKRVREHDESVMKNWKQLKMGNLPEIDPTLRAHIEGFAKRSKADLGNVKLEANMRPVLPAPKVNEFSSIITSCKQFQEAEKEELVAIPSGKEEQQRTESNPFRSEQKPAQPQYNPAPNQRPTEDETYLIDKVVDKRQMRLQDMKTLKMGIQSLPLDPAASSVELDNPSGTGVVDSVQKFASNEIVFSREDMQKYEVSTIKEQIYIPKKLYKRGATYKVEDCYYDSDGEFLYRIPGMTGKNVPS